MRFDPPGPAAFAPAAAADLSPKGIQQSAGIMINYLYRLSEIEDNHEAYTGEGRIVASPAISRLGRG